MTEPQLPLTERELQDLTCTALLDLMTAIEKTDRPEMAAMTSFVMAKSALVAFTRFTLVHFGTTTTADLLRCALQTIEKPTVDHGLADLDPRGSA